MKLHEPPRSARTFQPYLVAEIVVDEDEFADEPVNIPESVSEAAADKQRTTYRGRPARKLSEAEPQEKPPQPATTEEQPDDKTPNTPGKPEASKDSEEKPDRESKPRKKRRGRRGRRNRSKNSPGKQSGES
ncbi:hypothetical protein [Thalassoroseus pseudoceratinae]|uniref:hypothetical protein n=1 Tax=Thalassoroseus pseudoceratinae TaxID=2713176 RepID=UPI00141F8E19|nr:hypothetical protein [Thalassoroseus pseudoceratinae]